MSVLPSEEPLLGGYCTFGTRTVAEVIKSDFLGSNYQAAVSFTDLVSLDFFFFFNSLEHSNSNTGRFKLRSYLSSVFWVQFVLSICFSWIFFSSILCVLVGIGASGEL